MASDDFLSDDFEPSPGAVRSSRTPAQQSGSDDFMSPNFETLPKDVGKKVVAQDPEEDISLGSALSQGFFNLPTSGKKFVGDIAQAVVNPGETLSGIKEIGKGLYSKAAGIVTTQDPVQKAKDEAGVNAIGQMYKDHYGSWNRAKHTLAEDPFAVASDASMVVPGLGAAVQLPKAVGMTGRIGSGLAAAGRAAVDVGNMVNPINIAAAPIKKAAPYIAKAANIPGSMLTGAQPVTLNQAFKAGAEHSAKFADHMAGADPREIVDAAHEAVSRIAKDRSDAYKATMAVSKTNPAQINYGPIDQVIQNAYGDVFHGSQVYRPDAKAMLDAINNEVQNWKALPSTATTNYHDVFGVDKLKQLVGDIRDKAMIGTPEYRAGDQVYKGITKALTDADPVYAKTMSDYSDATRQLSDLRKTLSLGANSTTDSSLRKLLLGQKQIDGYKGNLLGMIMQKNPDIGNMIAGHLLHSPTGVGLRGNIMQTLTASRGLSGDIVGALALGAAGSPNLWGKANYRFGKGYAAPWMGGPLSKKYVMPPAAVEQMVRAQNEQRPQHAKGGRVGPSHTQLVDRLFKLSSAAKRANTASTKPLLDVPDEPIVKALAIAQGN